MADWYRARSKSGKPAGLGFGCQICGLTYHHYAPDEIFHCGAVETAPQFTLLLPERSCVDGGPVLPRNLLLIGDWETT